MYGLCEDFFRLPLKSGRVVFWHKCNHEFEVYWVDLDVLDLDSKLIFIISI